MSVPGNSCPFKPKQTDPEVCFTRVNTLLIVTHTRSIDIPLLLDAVTVQFGTGFFLAQLLIRLLYFYSVVIRFSSVKIFYGKVGWRHSVADPDP